MRVDSQFTYKQFNANKLQNQTYLQNNQQKNYIDMKSDSVSFGNGMNSIVKVANSLKTKIKNNGLALAFAAISLTGIGLGLSGCKEELTPDAWLSEWNRAYNECTSELPYHEQQFVMVPDPENFMGMPVPVYEDRSAETMGKMEEEYPDLVKYLENPEYRAKLEEQAERRGQQGYEQMMQLERQMNQDEQRRETEAEQTRENIRQRQEAARLRDQQFDAEREANRRQAETDRLIRQNNELIEEQNRLLRNH